MPRYLKVLRPLSITLCVKYSGYYTSVNVARHLIQLHSLKARQVREILEFIKSIGLIASCAGDILRPVYRGRPISGLPIYNSYSYNVVDCDFLIINVDSIKQHCFKLYNQKYKLTKSIPYQAAKLQTLQAKTQYVKYFIIIPLDQSSSSSNSNGAVGSSKIALLSTIEAKSSQNVLQIRFKKA